MLPIRTRDAPIRSPLIRSTSPANVQFFLPHASFSYDPNLQNGRLQSWNVTLEREIMPTYLIRVGYAGSKGDRLAMGRELNAAVFAPGATTATTNQRRPLFPTFSTITTIESTGRSIYNALQLTLDKRMSKRFSVLSSYTLSTNKDHAGEAKQTGTTQTNPSDLEFDWGYSNADRRHRFVTSFLWQIPGEFGNPVVSTPALRLVAHGHPGHAERIWLHRHERRRQRAHRHGQSARRHLGRSRPANRSSQSRRRSSAGSTRRSTLRMRWGPSATPGATICADRGRRTSTSACTRRSPRAAAPECSSASRRSTCSTG